MRPTPLTRPFLTIATITTITIAPAQSSADQILRSASAYLRDELLSPIHVDPPAASKTRDDILLTTGTPLRPVDTAWVESTLASMTLDEKIGQMIMPGYSSSTAPGLISNYKVGGFIFQGNTNTAPAVQTATNYLQGITSVPLIFSTDCEAGLGARFTDATRFPLNMGAGAAGDLDLIRQQGAITARECRAIGIQIGFGPVLDTNTEPINPIIGIRSYGDQPSSITAYARAYVQGARSEGLLCTYKHFPGHGASAGDSHDSLPTINISYADIIAKHVAPYAPLISEGTGDLVMTAHVWYPALDPGTTAWPATLSTMALSTILRGDLNYQGCLISDSFAMEGLMIAVDQSTYQGVKISVNAGLDLVLTPKSVPDAFNGLKDGVLNDEIPMSRIDSAVRRILALKSKVGMPEVTTAPASALTTVAHPANTAVAEQMGRKTIAARLTNSVLPVQPGQSLGVFVLGGNSTIFYSYASSNFTNALTTLHSNTTVISVPNYPDSSQRATLLNQARAFNKVLIVSMEWSPKVKYSEQVTLVNSFITDNRPLAYISFGSPYHWKQFNGNLPNFLCGFSSHYATQQEMAKVIIGQSQPTAPWPVTLTPAPAAIDSWFNYENK